MTEQQLSKGKEISEEILSLRGALADANKNSLFRMEERSCGYGYLADPFLSELNAQVRANVVEKINQRILFLESEFDRL